MDFVSNVKENLIDLAGGTINKNWNKFHHSACKLDDFVNVNFSLQV